MQQEVEMKNLFSKQEKQGMLGNCYEDEIEIINEYMNKMERIASQKIEIYNTYKANIEKVRGNIRNAEDLTARLRF